MPKSHTIKLNIKNDTTSPMLYHSNWFDSGRVANNFEFPKIIKKGENHTVVCYERDWALSGCSGYAQYTINGNIVTIAFSNPSAGSNKVGAGIADNGKTIWEKISSHDYQDFQVDMKVGTMPMIVHCKCSGGDTNDAKVVFHMPFSLRQDTNFAAPLCTANVIPEIPSLSSTSSSTNTASLSSSVSPLSSSSLVSRSDEFKPVDQSSQLSSSIAPSPLSVDNQSSPVFSPSSLSVDNQSSPLSSSITPSPLSVDNQSSPVCLSIAPSPFSVDNQSSPVCSPTSLSPYEEFYG